jgi:hypothetical protein
MKKRRSDDLRPEYDLTRLKGESLRVPAASVAKSQEVRQGTTEI